MSRRPAAGPRPATYVFCALQADRRPDLRRAPAGPPGCGPVRALDAGGGLWLVVADAPLPAYGDQALERGLKDLEWVSVRAVAHERVVEHCLALGTVLPMKLLTLFHGDERALQDVRRRRRALTALAGRVRGRLEWGVRLTVDEAVAAQSVRRQAAVAGRGATRGRAYLLRKTRERSLARELVHDAAEEARQVYDHLAGLSAAARRRPPAGASLVLDAAFLVDRRTQGRFQKAAGALQRRLAKGGLRLALTGPWPAYNFVGQRR